METLEYAKIISVDTKTLSAVVKMRNGLTTRTSFCDVKTFAKLKAGSVILVGKMDHGWEVISADNAMKVPQKGSILSIKEQVINPCYVVNYPVLGVPRYFFFNANKKRFDERATFSSLGAYCLGCPENKVLFSLRDKGGGRLPHITWAVDMFKTDSHTYSPDIFGYYTGAYIEIIGDKLFGRFYNADNVLPKIEPDFDEFRYYQINVDGSLTLLTSYLAHAGEPAITSLEFHERLGFYRRIGKTDGMVPYSVISVLTDRELGIWGAETEGYSIGTLFPVSVGEHDYYQKSWTNPEVYEEYHRHQLFYAPDNYSGEDTFRVVYPGGVVERKNSFWFSPGMDQEQSEGSSIQYAETDCLTMRLIEYRTYGGPPPGDMKEYAILYNRFGEHLYTTPRPGFSNGSDRIAFLKDVEGKTFDYFRNSFTVQMEDSEEFETVYIECIEEEGIVVDPDVLRTALDMEISGISQMNIINMAMV